MTKQTQSNVSTLTGEQTASAPTATSVATGSEAKQATKSNVVASPKLTGLPVLFKSLETADKDNQEKVAGKVQTLSQAKQQLAEAQDCYELGGDKAKEGATIASKAGRSLYTALASGVVNMAEINAQLGDVFGRVEKKDGTPGNTPLGVGNSIRQRIVRLQNARNLIDNGDGGAFFEGLDADMTCEPNDKQDAVSIRDVVEAVEQGAEGYTIWRAYELLAIIKRDNLDKVETVFDPKRIAAMVAKLSDETQDAAGKLRGNRALKEAYRQLFEKIYEVAQASEVPADSEVAKAA